MWSFSTLAMYMTEDCDASSGKYFLAGKERHKKKKGQSAFLRQETGFDDTELLLVLQSEKSATFSW